MLTILKKSVAKHIKSYFKEKNMQISIDNQTAEYVKDKLKNDTWWCATKMVDIINKAQEEDKKRAKCHHKWGKYEGKKECCVKCGTWGINQGEEWTLVSS